jgi:hypothetical protein
MKAAGAPGGPGKLTAAQKEYVVERLAAFDSPETVARSLHQKFGIAITRQSIFRYDPTRYPKCPLRWKLQFLATRQAILEGKGVQGAVNRAMRLRSGERVALRAIETLAGSILENITRQMEAGWVPNGPTPTGRPLSDEERARAILALLQKTGLDAPGSDASAGPDTDADRAERD